MRALKIATVVMGVLIVVGTMALVIVLARRSGSPPAPAASVAIPQNTIAATLDEPVGTSIAGMTALQDRLAVQLHGGGADRIVLLDPRTGAVTGRITLAR